MASRELHLYNIPSGTPFLATLIEAIVSGRLGVDADLADPAVLARTTIYLPTRRAARAFHQALAAHFNGLPLLLPRVIPLGDVEEAETALMAVHADQYDQEVPPAIDPLRRRLELTRLVVALGRSINRQALKLDPLTAPLMPATLADAFALGGELAGVLDQLQIEGIPYEALRNLNAESYDQLWAMTAAFLDIVGTAWPAMLTEAGLVDPAARRNLVLDAERKRLAAMTAHGPIIAAGSTGTVPATARLLRTIARLPHGAVVLPGLDKCLEEPAWSLLTHQDDPVPSHPQFALAQLLKLMQAHRDEVQELAVLSGHAAGLARARLTQEALRPAAASEAWASLAARVSTVDMDLAFVDLTLVEAEDERDEALAIAIALRQALETPGKTAALVTPDRGLAERVAVELQRWNITVDDSAGLSVFRTRVGDLALQCLRLVATGFAAPDVICLLRHPHLRMGFTTGDIQAAAATLDIGVIRGTVIKPGLAGLKDGLAHAVARAAHHHAPRPRKRLNAADFELAGRVVEQVERAFMPLVTAVFAENPQLSVIADAHLKLLLALLSDRGEEDGKPVIPASESSELAAVAGIFEGLANTADTGSLLEQASDYGEIFEALCQETIATPHRAAHPRLSIWGLLEARLLAADRVILSGLAEGSWPPAIQTDAFLNRPMRQQAGLSSPERRIGQTGHDFVEAIAAPEVIVTRALKNGGAETIPSRFWQRLKAVSPPEKWTEACDRGRKLMQLGKLLSQPMQIEPRSRPRPLPPTHLQPTALSVTEIETLYRDPYAIYARHVLQLDPLEGMVDEPSAADRGTLYHSIVEQFAKTYPDQLPEDAVGRILQIGRRLFDEAHESPEVEAFWWPRFVAVADKFVRWEGQRRADLAGIATEVSASFDFPLPDGTSFRLRAKADRIETTGLGQLRIVDFKTGRVPTAIQIREGFAPQLTLQEALAIRGGFRAVGARPVERSTYVKLSHEEGDLKEGPSRKEAPTPETSEQHLADLLRQVALYRAGELPFLPHRAIERIHEKATYIRPYDQLARVKEWSGASGSGEEGEDEA